MNIPFLFAFKMAPDMGTLLVFCIYTYTIAGGWSVVNIPGDGSVWGINSIQFIREKALGSPAFYTIDTYYMDQFTPSILRVYKSYILDR